MNLNLEGKTVIVTGAGSNIGRAIALAFSRERANVVVAEIDEGQGAKTAAEAGALGATAIAVRTVPGPIAKMASPSASTSAARHSENRIRAVLLVT